MKTEALGEIALHEGIFRSGFSDWLSENWELYERFEAEANEVVKRGRRHYSAHTIIEYLRHDTQLRSDGEFKLNEAWTSSMARLYALRNPMTPPLFQFRTREGGVVAELPQ